MYDVQCMMYAPRIIEVISNIGVSYIVHRKSKARGNNPVSKN